MIKISVMNFRWIPMKATQKFFTLTGILAIFTISSCKKENNQAASANYFPKVRAIISNNCLTCHSSSGSWAGRPTKFDSDSDITSNYIAIKRAVADPVTITNKRMPQGGTLSASDIEIIVQWFNKGGKVTD